jgi:hypothetical protein
LQQASTGLESAHEILSQCAAGSTSELPDAVAHLDFGRQQAMEAIRLCQLTIECIEGYLIDVGVHQVTASPGTAPHRSAGHRQSADPALVAEVRQLGHKISAERVVRIGRDHRQRIVWLETGDANAGMYHVLNANRVREFRDAGVAEVDIVDLVFRAATEGAPVGTTGRDRPVFAVRYRGQHIRVAVTIASNGFIVGANPISANKKLKPLS